MAQPVWLTDAGNLGTIQEGKFFKLPLLAEDPDDGTVYFTVLAGSLLQGVPNEVGENITSQFSIRAYTKTDGGAVNRLNDRTFNLVVTGQDVPEFTTNPGELGRWFDGDRVDYQIEFTDDDPNDTVEAYIATGALPPGLTMSNTGLISGYIDPVADLDSSAIAGWDGEDSGNFARWDEFPWDFATRSISKNYEFTVKITDGKEYRIRTFSMFVYSRDSLTADNTEITVDSDYITVDTATARAPFIDNYPTNGVLPAYRHDNFYAYQFDGEDPDGDPFQFAVQSGDLPPGLDVDTDTGFLFGYIPDIGFQDVTYTFTIRIFKKDNPSVLRDFAYSLNIFGDVDTEVTWNTAADIGTIVNGEISVFNISATHALNYDLQYRLKQGSASKLPQGLKLLPSGNIIGRVSYETFSLDGNTTTFDKDIRTRLIEQETTFDREYTFTVQAYNSAEIVNVERTFTITVDRQYDKPAQCMRIEAFPPQDDRDLIASIVNNLDVFKSEWIYRPDDPWFGVRKKVWYEHAYGLEPSTFQEYTDAIAKNHYRKKIVLGELKTALAKDDADNVLYEVVYATVVDTAVNNNGESAALEQTLKYPINEDDSTEIDTVYPNSLENMRTRVISNIGQVAPILPRWMLSKQEDGDVLGFTRAWVMCYTQPGRSKQIKYEIEQKFGTVLNKVDFDADRYVLGWYSAQHWDSVNDEWEESLETTFDREASAPYADPADETLFDGGETGFMYNIDKHEYTDVYDKYVIFPQQRIIDNGE
jgi:hypothetical protein